MFGILSTPMGKKGAVSLSVETDIVMSASPGVSTLNITTTANAVSLNGSHPALSTLSIIGTALQSLNLIGATNLSVISIVGNPPLTTVDATGLKLTQASVDAIISACLLGGEANGSIEVAGGTNAAPSGLAAEDVLTLEANGWFVTTN